MGPHTFNFGDAAELALAAGAATRVADIADGVAAASRSPRRRRAARDDRSRRALAFAGAHRGAAERMATRILDALDARAPRSRAAVN